MGRPRPPIGSRWLCLEWGTKIKVVGHDPADTGKYFWVFIDGNRSRIFLAGPHEAYSRAEKAEDYLQIPGACELNPMETA